MKSVKFFLRITGLRNNMFAKIVNLHKSAFFKVLESKGFDAILPNGCEIIGVFA